MVDQGIEVMHKAYQCGFRAARKRFGGWRHIFSTLTESIPHTTVEMNHINAGKMLGKKSSRNFVVGQWILFTLTICINAFPFSITTHAASSISLNSTNPSNATSLGLTAGEYLVQYVGGAWNAWGGGTTGCDGSGVCATGWLPKRSNMELVYSNESEH